MRRFVLILGLLVVAMAGCRAQTNVDIRIGASGSGNVSAEVRLDKEAVGALGDVKTALRTDDLKSGGWKIDGPRVDGDETVLEASHSFSNPEEVTSLVDQLVPQGGPLRDFEIRQQRSLSHVQTGFAGSVDLTRGIASWGDPTLQQRTGQALGVDPAQVGANLDTDLTQNFPLTVTVHLPGGQTTRVPQTSDGTWQIPYNTMTQLSANSEGANTRPLVLLGIAILLVLGAIAVGTFWRVYKPRHITKTTP